MKRAFTLVETIMVVALAVALVFACTQLYVVYGRSILVEQSSINITLGGSSIMDAVRTAGLQASHVVASHAFSGVTYTSTTTTVVFELPSVDAAGAVITNTYDYIAIFASSTSAYQLTSAAVGSDRVSGQKLLTTSLSALSYTYNSVSFPLVTDVVANATTSALVRGVTTQAHFLQHIYLRNI
jgi:hypothetical protein